MSEELTVQEAQEYKDTHKGRYPDSKGRVVSETLKKAKKQEQRIARLQKNEANEIVERERLDMFLEEFLVNGGNATKAAAAVFNCKSKSVAAVMGSTYLKRARDVGRLVMEKNGVSYDFLIETAKKKMLDAKDPAWWDRFMKIAGYADFLAKEKVSPQLAVNIVASEKSILSKYIDEDELEGTYVDEVNNNDDESEE
jgi:hypothetical protein